MPYNKISIVIPTYNEKDNIAKLIPEIFSQIGCEIIVVDDNSPDGTAGVVEGLAKKYNVKLIKRKGKLGIGSAYKAGFESASGDIIFEMDADFSHDPKHIKDFVQAIGNCDAVVGSRYIKGGTVVGWGFYRKAVSRTANFLAHFFLRIPVNDVTSGYRAYRKSALKKIDIERIKSEGYSFQLEILHYMVKAGLRINEIPIIFNDRRIGKSKLGKKEIFNFARTVLRLLAKG